MIRPRLRLPMILTAAAIASGTALATTLPAGAAVSTLSPPTAGVRIESPATLANRGATVSVPVLVSCDRGADGFLSVQVTQRVASTITSASGNTQFTCTGGIQPIDVVATVATLSRPLKKGTAHVSASMFACNQAGCTGSEDARDVKLVG